MKADKLVVYYKPEMALKVNVEENYSKSPMKPRLFIQYLLDKGWGDSMVIKDFEPFGREDFLIAHTAEYVDAFLGNKKPLCESNGLKWTPEFAESVRYTNASLYYAIKHSIDNPLDLVLSPTSGFHHAKPHSGGGFCTFSGQVIASVKIYREREMSGAYLDLDGHFGNSIEDSRGFVKDLNKAIPLGCNINPTGVHGEYIKSLKNSLKSLEEMVLENKVHYVVWCHGADSHEEDPLGHQCTTEEWLQCSRIFYGWALNLYKKHGINLPVVVTLFGGYKKNYEEVLELHYQDIRIGVEILSLNGDLNTNTFTFDKSF